jgi:hypothetical protein
LPSAPAPELPAAETESVQEDIEDIQTRKQAVVQQIEAMRANLTSTNPFKNGVAKLWLRNFSDLLVVTRNAEGEVVDFAIAPSIEVQQPDSQPEENSFKVGDAIFVASCPHTDKHGPFPIERIEGDFAKVEMFAKLIPLSDLRRS